MISIGSRPVVCSTKTQRRVIWRSSISFSALAAASAALAEKSSASAMRWEAAEDRERAGGAAAHASSP
eukprot:1263718-Prymnesium_polylepis.1